jgi:hypothetical protein
VGTSKILARYEDSTISLQAALHLGHMPRALMTKKKKKKKPLSSLMKNIQRTIDTAVAARSPPLHVKHIMSLSNILNEGFTTKCPNIDNKLYNYYSN